MSDRRRPAPAAASVPETVPPPAPLRVPLGLVAGCALVFFLLQSLLEESRGTALERWLVDAMTVAPAVALLGLVSPERSVVAAGASLVGRDGQLNVLAGCEGTEVMLLLVLAIVAARRGWRASLAGLAAGLALVWASNVLRTITLYLAFARSREAFDMLHALVAPLAVVAVAVLFFAAWLRWVDRGGATDRTP